MRLCHMARSTQAQRAERVRAAQELLARGTSMVEAAVALSRDFGLSRRQAYRYLEEAQAVASPPVVAEASVTITCRSAARPEPIRGAENAEIRCRIGAKSGAAFRRNHLPLSTEIRCRFAPIFALWKSRAWGIWSANG